MHPTQVKIDPTLLVDPRCKVRLAMRDAASDVPFLQLDDQRVSQPIPWPRARGIIAAVGSQVAAAAIYIGAKCDSIHGWNGEYGVIAKRFGLIAGDDGALTPEPAPEPIEIPVAALASMSASELEELCRRVGIVTNYEDVEMMRAALSLPRLNVVLLHPNGMAEAMSEASLEGNDDTVVVTKDEMDALKASASVSLEEAAPAPVMPAQADTKTPPEPITMEAYAAMDRGELDAWALEALSLDLDGRWNEKRMRRVIERHPDFENRVLPAQDQGKG